MAVRYRVTKVFTAGPDAGSSVEFTTTVEFRRGDSVRFPARGYAFRIERVEKLSADRPMSRRAPVAESPVPLPELPSTSSDDQTAEIYRELRSEWNASNAPILAVRKRAFELLGGSHVRLVYRKQFSEGDCDSIPGLDDVAQSIACEFGFVRSTDQLFEILKSPAPQAPTREELLKQARELATAKPVADADSFDFGHNLTF